jgi:hypothetical protein
MTLKITTSVCASVGGKKSETFYLRDKFHKQKLLSGERFRLERQFLEVSEIYKIKLKEF